MDDNQIIIVKFSNKINDNFIDIHREIIEKYEFCWMGKIGKCFSEKVLNIMIERGFFLLYYRKRLYKAYLNEYSFDKIKEEVPFYYHSEFYDYYEYPSVYLRITSIQDMDINDLDKLESITSHKKISESIIRCMNPVMIAKCVEG